MSDTTSDFPIYYKRTLLTDAMTDGLALTRYAIKDGQPDKSRIAMSTDAGMVFIEQGASNWVIDSTSKTGMKCYEHLPPHVSVKAEWFDTVAALKNNIKVVAGGSANSFGGMGALLVPDGFTIPTVLATKENVLFYGLQLVDNGEVLTVHSDQVDLLMLEYDYTAIYKKDFLMQEHGGGGVFVERHNFPHIHIPMHPSCGGYIVIGKQVSADEFKFTAFQIPWGCALYTPANTIHGDGTLVGEYGLALADSSMITADTVLIYNKNTLKMAHGVVPDWPGH
jgi:hypothetical protein